jgi:hypothetical protein
VPYLIDSRVVVDPEIATLTTERRRCCLMYNFRVRGYSTATRYDCFNMSQLTSLFRAELSGHYLRPGPY